MLVMEEANPTAKFCFAMETRGSARLILGRKDKPSGIKERQQALITSLEVSSLVIDSLCDHARPQAFAVACFYFDFAAREQSSTSILGALLKQLVVGLGEVPREMSLAYEERNNFLGGRRPRHSDIVRMLQVASFQKPTFICIDALDECVPEHLAKLLDSLNQILQMAPGTRIFVTGRPHIRQEVDRRLAGRVTSLLISTKRVDIIRYLHARLAGDITPDAMDGNLEAGILKKIPEDFSEMYVEAPALGKLLYLKHPLIDTNLDSY